MKVFTAIVGSKGSLFHTSNPTTAGTFNSILMASIRLSPPGYNKSTAK
jgi:hypothetical protein